MHILNLLCFPPAASYSVKLAALNSNCLGIKIILIDNIYIYIPTKRERITLRYNCNRQLTKRPLHATAFCVLVCCRAEQNDIAFVLVSSIFTKLPLHIRVAHSYRNRSDQPAQIENQQIRGMSDTILIMDCFCNWIEWIIDQLVLVGTN